MGGDDMCSAHDQAKKGTCGVSTCRHSVAIRDFSGPEVGMFQSLSIPHGRGICSNCWGL